MLLGTPVGGSESVESTIKDKTEVLRLMGDRLSLLSSHDALVLLHHSFAIPRVLFVLRTAPCFLSPLLEAFDELLRSILTRVINIPLDDESAWLHASLPVRAGGIGVRRAVRLAPSAYLASATGCSDLVSQLFPPHLQNYPDPHHEAALTLWKEGHSHPPPDHLASCKQKMWDAPKVEATFSSIMDGASLLSQTRLLAVSCPESGAWLHPMPISSVGLRMDDDVIRVTVGLYLGLPLCHPHECHDCSAPVDEFATHGLSCRFSRGRHSRHAAVNDIVQRSLAAAKVPSHLEPSGLYRSHGKRPDGATIISWKMGKILVWDVTCVDTLAPSHRDLAPRGAGVVADEAEHRKKLKYSNLDLTHLFTLVARKHCHS